MSGKRPATLHLPDQQRQEQTANWSAHASVQHLGGELLPGQDSSLCRTSINMYLAPDQKGVHPRPGSTS